MCGWLNSKIARTKRAVARKRPRRVYTQSLNFGSLMMESCILKTAEARDGGRYSCGDKPEKKSERRQKLTSVITVRAWMN